MAVTSKRRIILDVDAGTDDAHAILLLLDADKRGLIKVEAIVCTMGNTDVHNVCKNVIRFLEMFKRTDIPVYKGSVNSIITSKDPLEKFHGIDGLGDLEHETEPDISIIRKEPAIIAINDIVKRNPNEITLVCFGPLTNAALAVKVYHDLASNLRDMFIMGGNYLGIGNTNDAAEFNFYVDPEAAYTVFEEFGCPITLVPWEIYIESEITLGWRFDILGQYKSSFMELLNKAEKKIYSECDLSSPWYACDAIACLVMLNPEIVVNQNKYNLTVELHGTNTRGQVIVRRGGNELKRGEEFNEKANIVVIEKVNFDLIKKHLVAIAERIM